MPWRRPSSWPLPAALILVLAGFSANSLLCRAALLMLAAGAAWGAYTWLGRGSSRALVDTAALTLGGIGLALTGASPEARREEAVPE